MSVRGFHKRQKKKKRKNQTLILNNQFPREVDFNFHSFIRSFQCSHVKLIFTYCDTVVFPLPPLLIWQIIDKIRLTFRQMFETSAVPPSEEIGVQYTRSIIQPTSHWSNRHIEIKREQTVIYYMVGAKKKYVLHVCNIIWHLCPPRPIWLPDTAERHFRL